MKKWTVGDVMTRDVVTVGERTRYLEITRLLAESGISAVPVLDHAGRVVGVVSEADLLHKVEFAGSDTTKPLWQRPSQRAARVKSVADTASRLMTSPAVTIEPEADLAQAAKLMHQHDIKRLPVVDSGGRLVGIVSRTDLLRVYLRTDSQIRDEIVDGVVKRTLWIDPVAVEVDVIDGRVALRGRLDRRSTATLLVRLVTAVPGVIEVSDELRWEYDDDPETAAGYYRSHPFTAT
ncbi:MAG TPA: CBS domain-containing protein [Candidatus Limnocylindrales bacterium]|nr:CBS domain-containing protein [Candidatus Limnocylindrales bacterium]